MPTQVYDDQDSKIKELEESLKGPSAAVSGSDIAHQKELAAVTNFTTETPNKTPNKPYQSSENKDTDNSTSESNNPSWFTGKGSNKKKKGWWTKPKAAAAAGIVTSVLGLSAFVVAPLTGPLEFIHFAQSIQLPHFGAQEDAADGRLNKLMRMARSGNVGQTRISYLQSKYLKRIQLDMEKAGFKSEFDRLGYYTGTRIDTEAEKSPYRGMSEEEVSRELTKDFGEGSFEMRDGQPYINEKSSYRQQHRVFVAISKKMNYKGVTAAMRARPLEMLGGVSWNPLDNLNKKTNQTILAFVEEQSKKRNERIKQGANTGTIDTTNAKEKSADGKTETPIEGGASQDLSSENTKNILTEISGSKALQVTGGVGAIVGVACLGNDLANRIGDLKYTLGVLPLMRQGMDIIASGNQIQSGEGFNDLQLEVLSKKLRGADSEGNVTEWSQAASIRANNGGEGGVPLDKSVQTALVVGTPVWLTWALEEPVPTICSTAGQFIVGGASIVVTIASGGTVTALLSILATPLTSLIQNKALDGAAGFISGEGIDVSVVGAQLGSQADYGAALGANLAGMQSGADVLSATEALELYQATEEDDLYAFSKLPLSSRLFDVKNRRSLAGKMVDSYPTSGAEVSKNMASLFTGSLSRIGSAISSNSPSAKAQKLNYNYGDLEKFGYSFEELGDSRVADPYANAESVANLLESSDGARYVQKAKDCYGVAIAKTVNGWGATTVDDAYKRYFSGEREKFNCEDRIDENWLKVRFFIFDTSTIEAYACLQGEGESCQNVGFGTPQAAPTTDVGTPPSLSDMSKESVSVPCASGTKDIGVQDGYTEGNLVKIRVCAVTGIKNIAGISRFPGDNGYVSVNSRLSASWYALAQKAAADGIKLEATSGFRTMAKQQELYGGDPRLAAKPGYSNHQMGLAIDFAGPSSKNASAQKCSQRVMDLNSPVWVWLNNNTAKYGIRQYSAEAWHWDPDPGGDGNRCGGDGSLRS